MPRRLSSRTLIAAFVALAAAPLASTAARADYACRVPRAILCDGCAKAIAITLQRDGSCRISFTPTASATDAAAGAPQPTDINFQVDVAPAPRIVRRAAYVPGYARHVSWLRAAPEAHCFVFNDRRYCE
ncbi:MAG: hypothetical protein ACLQE9_16480 [Roseiarcus sp.]